MSPTGSSPRGSSGLASPRSAASLRRSSNDNDDDSSSNTGSPDQSPAAASPRGASSRVTTPPSRGLTPSASSRRLGSLRQASSSQIEAEIQPEAAPSDLPSDTAQGYAGPPADFARGAETPTPLGNGRGVGGGGGRSWAATVTGELGHGASLESNPN